MLLAALATLGAHAQTQDIAVWTAALASPDVSDRTRVWLDVHARRSQASFLSIVRPGVGLQFTSAVSGWLGYAWIPTVPDDGATRHEHRIWQQLIGNISLGDRWTLQSRTRFEQRFAVGGGVGLRVREFVRLSVAPEVAQRPRLALWDELFVGLNDTDWGAVAGFDQNRLFVGVGLPVSHGGRVEVGLLNVLALRDELQVSWVVAANWFVPRTLFRSE